MAQPAYVGAGEPVRQVAQRLSLDLAQVADPLVRAVAAQSAAAPPALLGCWVNTGWSRGLSVDPVQRWEDQAPADDEAGGLVSVLVARRHRFDKVSMCGFLTDVYCLGVKNALGPEITDEVGLRQFVPTYYTAYPHGWQSAPIELAQHLVFGAVAYARGLGFEPHRDFADAAGHLGGWEGPSAITFGKDGKPFYISGPNDNPRKVIKTLEHAVGPPPNFDFVLMQEARPAIIAL